MKWQSLLTHKELTHMCWALVNRPTLKDFKILREKQRELEERLCSHACYECDEIERKLRKGAKL